jgi:hypothetical protein
MSVCPRNIRKIKKKVGLSAQFYLLNTRWSDRKIDEVMLAPLDREGSEPQWLQT